MKERCKGEDNVRSIRIDKDENRIREDTAEGEEILPQQINTIFGLCAVCHLTFGNTNSNFNQNVPCSREHILCQRCIQHFKIPPGRLI